MPEHNPGGAPPPDPQTILAWAQFYAFGMGWVIQPIHKPMGYAPDGRQICSCELTGKKWNNCNEEKPGKHPWKGWKQAPMDTPEQGYNTFFSIWQQYPTGLNIGVRTGRVSNIWAIDLDMGGGKNGVIDLERWMASNGLSWDDLPTLSAATGGGGYHYIFSYPDKVEKIPTVAPHADIGPSVDIKGDGGYILVAPSLHASGKQYEWRSQVTPEATRSAPTKIVTTVQGKKRNVGNVDISYTPSFEELKDHADELSRKKSQRAKMVGKNMVLALGGTAIMEDGGAHDAYRDIMFYIAKRWNRCDPAEILTHFQDSVAERFAHKAGASTDMQNLMDSMHTALEKANEEAQGWLGQIAVNDSGRPITTDPNLLLYFRNHPAWKDVFGYDMRSNKPVYLKPPPLARVNGTTVDLSRDKTDTALWFQARAMMAGRVSRDDLQSAILAAAWDNAFDPLYNLLASLRNTWDGQPRLESALQRVAGSPDTEWVRTIFPIWMKSLVARILWPGCKADSMLILEGAQGCKKSTFFSSLLPETRYFSDSLSKVSHNVESIRLVHSGPAIFELGELSGLRKQEVEAIKAFLSASEDDLRPLYEPPRKTKRRCIFVGTTNRDDYLRDETGGRRFWPVKVSREIDIDMMLEEREQWFAEALARVESGENWWLTNGKASSLAQAEQDSRFEEDIWHQPISNWLDRRAPEVSADASTTTDQMQVEMNKQLAGEYITTVQVAEYALQLEIKNARSTEGIRINKILRHIGWTPTRTSIDGKQVRAWRRPLA